MKTKITTATPSPTATLRAMKIGQHFVLPLGFPNAGPAAYNAAKQIGAEIRTMKTPKGLLIRLEARPTVIKNEKTFPIRDGKVEFSGRGRPTLAAAAKAKAKNKGKKAPAKAAKPAKKAAAPKKAKAKVAKTAKPKTRKLNATEAAAAAAAF